MIRHYINYQQNNWDDLLPVLERAYNSSVHATTGLAPFMMKFGQIPRNMADIMIEPSSTSVECVSEFVKRIQGLVTSAVTSIDQANKTAEGYANKSRRVWHNQNPIGESGGHVGRDCRKTAQRRGVQWGVWGAHASRQGKPGLAHQHSKLKEGVD
jgi:hypothetical protein